MDDKLYSGDAAEPTDLRRSDKDKMLCRVARQYGRGNFMPKPAEYSVRVQLTGYKSLESSGRVVERGKVYELELRVARN